MAGMSTTRRFDASHTRPRVLTLGNREHPDFTSLTAWLNDNVEESRSPADDAAFDVILFLAERPSMIDAAEVERIRGIHPWSRCYLVTGSWCEGEMRSGKPIPGIERIAWWEAVSRLERMVNASEPFVPRTESPVERILRLVPIDAGRPIFDAVVIASRTRAGFESLVDLCSGISRHPYRWYREAEEASSADCVIWDGYDLATAAACDELAGLRRRFPSARLFVLMNFPRTDDIAKARAIGAEGVLGKPLVVADLLAMLQKPSSAIVSAPVTASSAP